MINPTRKNSQLLDKTSALLILSALKSKTLKLSWQDNGTVFFEIGDLVQEQNRNRPQGEFSLMIDSPWRFEKYDQIVCSSAFDEWQRDKFLERFSEQNILKTNLFTFCNDLEIQFDKIKFRQFCVDSNLNSWSLYVRNENKKYLKTGPHSFWLYFENNQFLIEFKTNGER